jgi:hypothetical protein
LHDRLALTGGARGGHSPVTAASCLALVVGDDLFLDQLMDRALFGAHEARAHVDALGAERQGGDQAAAVAEAAGGDHRDPHLVGGYRDENKPGRIVLAWMARALKPVDRNRIDPHALRRQRVADAGAFVHDHDAVLLEFRDVLLRLVAGGLDDLDAALDDGLAVFGVRRRFDRRENGQVDAERLVGEAAAACDFPGTELILRTMRNTSRVARNAVSTKVVALEKEGATFEQVRDLVAGARGKMVYATGDADEGIWSAGQVQGLIHDIPSCAELVSRIMREAEAIIQGRLEGMISGNRRQAAE